MAVQDQLACLYQVCAQLFAWFTLDSLEAWNALQPLSLQPKLLEAVTSSDMLCMLPGALKAYKKSLNLHKQLAQEDSPQENGHVPEAAAPNVPS